MISRVCAAAFLIGAAFACAPPPLPPAIRFEVTVPDDRILGSFAISPSGERLAYSAENAADGRLRLYVRSLSDGQAPADEVAGTIGARAPFFSPDGSAVAYFAAGAMWRVDLQTRGRPIRITDAPLESAGGAWTSSGRIVFAPLRAGLMSLPDTGGEPTPLTTLNDADGELDHGWPHPLPDGSIVFTVAERGRDAHLEVVSETGKRTRLRVPIVGQAQFIQTGQLVYSFLGNLMSVRFSLDDQAIEGVPSVAVKGVQTRGGYGALGRSSFAVSPTGTLVWLRADADDASSRLVRVDRTGTAVPLAAAAAVMQTPRVSPDGRKLAVVARSGVMTREIRVMALAPPNQITFAIQGGDNQSPAWRDSRRLTFGSNRDGVQKIYTVAVDQKRPPVPLFSANATAARNPASWANRLLALYEIEPARGRNVLVYRIDESIAPVAATDANERSPTVSPDGKWIAYVSDASGRDEVYASRLDRGESSRITNSGATEPVWTREGLFYREGDSIVLRALEKGSLGEPRPAIEGQFERDPGANLASYDVDPRGRYFIMLKSARKPRELRVVKNWGTELGSK